MGPWVRTHNPRRDCNVKSAVGFRRFHAWDGLAGAHRVGLLLADRDSTVTARGLASTAYGAGNRRLSRPGRSGQSRASSRWLAITSEEANQPLVRHLLDTGARYVVSRRRLSVYTGIDPQYRERRLEALR